jgi:hypothetical protein
MAKSRLKLRQILALIAQCQTIPSDTLQLVRAIPAHRYVCFELIRFLFPQGPAAIGVTPMNAMTARQGSKGTEFGHHICPYFSAEYETEDNSGFCLLFAVLS